jgi:hypothetical protein
MKKLSSNPACVKKKFLFGTGVALGISLTRIFHEEFVFKV